MDYKKYIDNYYTKRYNDLKSYYERFCLPSEREHFGEMVSQLYIHLIDNIEKVKIWIDKDELHYFCIKYIYNQRNWSGTDFKKSITIKDNVFDEQYFNEGVEDEITTQERHYEKETETNLKLELLSNAVSHLDYYERYVYTQYFINKKTLRGIAGDVGLSHIAIHRIVKKIKSKLQSIIQKQINNSIYINNDKRPKI